MKKHKELSLHVCRSLSMLLVLHFKYQGKRPSLKQKLACYQVKLQLIWRWPGKNRLLKSYPKILAIINANM